ncbi:LysR family transcriptional regulator [Paenibacillus glycinis]|uniref:LysR family transcriptional regulator n=1 Tax=Paenibacillus glycinis TaxID=2697035 RepID=A0ABW9XL70_9BACL|nr:LysR family transcriptional regulator [Paenibacillus glycinis]NBD23246.1 LysR family transcriptional regulator [Paenibacillus glycinis]
MELRQLEYFHAICGELHFTRAADKLGISQPTLSHQIKSLEDEIGTPLFDRIGKRIALTEAGSVLKSHAAVIFGALRSAKDQIEELHDGERGSLSIGSLPGELNHLVASQLVEYNKHFPKIRIKIVAAEDVAEKVIHNELDAAVTLLPVDEERLSAIPLYDEQFYLTVSRDHPLAEETSIPFADVQELPVIWFPQDHKCRQLIEATCRTTGFVLNPIIETNTIESIMNLVKSGAGVSILSKSLIQLYNDGHVRAIPIVDPVLHRQVVIIYNRDKFLSRSVRAFIDLLGQFVEDHHIREGLFANGSGA